MSERFFLIDCNNFYASCERVFRPELSHKPIIVLSNNDGCFISRSDEVRHLGIPMGAPYFKWKKQVEEMKAELFSANFSLYGDISNRVMSILRTFSDKMEIYSIDEAFLVFKDVDDTLLTQIAVKMRQTIKKWTGIPVTIGIGETKTLAKLANKIARKSNPDGTNVCNLATVKDINTVLAGLPVEIVWGIGYKSALFLNSQGITNVLQVKNAPDKWLQKHMGIVGVRIAHELRGLSCLALEEVRPAKKGITSSRSFGRPVVKVSELKEAVSAYTSRAAEKLREEDSVAACIHVSIRTNRFKPEEYYAGNYSIPLPCPTAYTPELIKYALQALDTIYVPGRYYKKAMVMLTGILPETRQQLNLFERPESIYKQKKLMHAFDAINLRYGRHVVRFAAEGATQLWNAKSEQRSPSYTTDWKSLPRVK